ncbi:Alkaline phosphatase, partial [hydrothermal vent metagenome]
MEDPNDPKGFINYYLTRVYIQPSRLEMLTQSYQALRDSVYNALLPQTRLKPYLDAMSVAVDASGKVSLDFTGMEAAFNAAIGTNALNGITDLVDLLDLKLNSLRDAGWVSWEYLSNTLGTVTNTPEISARLDELNIIYAGYEGSSKITGSVRDDIIIGTTANETLLGGDGNDLLYGGDGTDILMSSSGKNKLYGGAGNDVLGNKTNTAWRNNEYNGGLGNDILNGTQYSDMYYFNMGDGRDTIDETGGNSYYQDKIILGTGIAPTDVSMTRDGNDWLMNFRNGTDQIRILDWYANTGVRTNNRVESLAFADGTVWDVNTLEQGGLEVHGTAGNDTMTGLYDKDDRLYGEGGNDTITGGSERDWLYGGAGNDVLG